MEKTVSQLVRESKTAIDIGLTKEARQGVIEILDKILCDENIIGMNKNQELSLECCRTRL